MTPNIPLIVGAALSALAALLHICVIFGGPAWYRFFGAGERMAAGAAAGHWYPPILTLLIACVLATWAAYALSGAGVLQPLPLLAFVLPAITAVYLVRGARCRGAVRVRPAAPERLLGVELGRVPRVRPRAPARTGAGLGDPLSERLERGADRSA
ncbi:hypothetical protein [Variovorax sp. 770b2]|uniref:hypothetical protein n=1 Tax=Variovorax sp. 770b2 TaxID=1566271 RepID=UPI0008ED5BC8|nr:hypothetical protein [Variovorax sp. 770b2]SFP90350.1 hypothetical protein SAMN03159339_4501 [Variovorax sp. 770b2]